MEERTEQKLEWITPEIIDLDIEKTSKTSLDIEITGGGPNS